MAYSDAQFSLMKIYLGAFLRAPELEGFNYWSGLLAEQPVQTVANNIFALPVVQELYPVRSTNYTNRDFVSDIYQNVFGKNGDTEGLNFWAARLDMGWGRGDLVLEMINVGLSLPANTPGQAYVANRYWAARYALDKQVNDKSTVSTANLRDQMDKVTADANTLTPYVNNITTLSQLSSQLGVLTYSSAELHESSLNDGSVYDSIVITLTGDNFTGNIGDSLGEVSNVPSGLTATLTKESAATARLTLTGEADDHGFADSIANLTVGFSKDDFLGADLAKISNPIRSDLEVKFYDLPANVINAKLTAGGALTGALVVNLATNKFTLGGADLALSSGDISTAVDADLASVSAGTAQVQNNAQSGVSASFVGDAASNDYWAPAVDGTIRGAGGNDTLTGGSGVDTYIFETTASANGLDEIHDFAVGAGGDVLNVSGFLRLTMTDQAGDVFLSTDTAANAWENGEVLVVQGYDAGGLALDSVDVQGLFGAGKVFAAPTVASKMVVITCGVEGDANVWFITNAGDPTLIEALEVMKVAVLVGVNNLSLLPFDAENFA